MSIVAIRNFLESFLIMFFLCGCTVAAIYLSCKNIDMDMFLFYSTLVAWYVSLGYSALRTLTQYQQNKNVCQ